MDNVTRPCPSQASDIPQPQDQQDLPAPKLPPDTPLSPVTSSASTENDGSLATAPEGGEEVWSDAQEVDGPHKDGATAQQGTETGQAFDDQANVSTAISGLKPELGQVEVVSEDNKGPSDLMTVEHQSSISRPPTSANRPEAATTGTPSRETPSMPPSPAASSSMHASTSLAVPSSNSSARAVSPSPQQGSHSLDRRQSRRRSAIDVRLFITFFFYFFTLCTVLVLNLHAIRDAPRIAFQAFCQTSSIVVLIGTTRRHRRVGTLYRRM